ncbi:MAG: Ig-like domain-containing protein [Prevotellaceae bacterium]|jgi:uncharacterized protein (TIGR02145 family)|nr:Ig-like domain-containing protein [Prevotellaceae bacterium]
MKKIFFSIGLLLTVSMATVVFNACGKDDPADPTDPANPGIGETTETTDPGVEINGIIWATRNIDKPGTFASNTEGTGMYYQWNKKIGWSATDPLKNSNNETTWDNTMSEGTEWAAENDPSPAGWRVPTIAELATLFDADKVTNEFIEQNSVRGRKFTDKASGKYIFLPLAGSRSSSLNGGLDGYGNRGSYWSSTGNSETVAMRILFIGNGTLTGSIPGPNSLKKDYGLSVRSVAYNSKPDIVAVTNISLNKITLSLAVGEEFTLTATITPNYATDKTVTWTSSDNAKATVVGGKVTAKTAGTVTITAKAGDKTATCTVTVKAPLSSGESVVINGVKWATRNVASPGTFASNPESAGMIYQWNRKKGWSASGIVEGWDGTDVEGNMWENANDPSPSGYRMPTLAEIQSLANTTYVTNEWTTINGVNGRLFTDKTSGNSLFLPAVGMRSFLSGSLSNTNFLGVYWCNEEYDDYNAYNLSFTQSEKAFRTYDGKRIGYSVRSVANE